MNNAKRAAMYGLLFIFLVLVGGITKLYFLIFLGFISLIVALYFTIKNNDDFKNKSNELFLNALIDNNITPDKKVFSHDKLCGIAINEKQAKVAFVSRKTINDEYIVKTFNFKDVIEAKVITNKQTITSTSLSSASTRGIIGGMIAGGIGSIIGGVTAKQKSSSKIKELTLELVVNDLLNPRYTVTFYKSELALDGSNSVINLTEEWYRVFSVIINRNNQEARSV